MLEVLLQICQVNGGERGLLGHANGEKPEVPLETGIDYEGTSCVIHGCDKLSVLDLHERQLVLVIPMLVISVLPQKSNGSLSVVGIWAGQVQVIHEVEELL